MYSPENPDYSRPRNAAARLVPRKWVSVRTARVFKSISSRPSTVPPSARTPKFGRPQVVARKLEIAPSFDSVGMEPNVRQADFLAGIVAAGCPFTFGHNWPARKICNRVGHKGLAKNRAQVDERHAAAIPQIPIRCEKLGSSARRLSSECGSFQTNSSSSNASRCRVNFAEISERKGASCARR